MHRSPHLSLCCGSRRSEGSEAGCSVRMSLSCLFGLAFGSGEWKHGTAVNVRHEWSSLAVSTHFSQWNEHQREVRSCDNSELIIHAELSRNTAAVYNTPCTTDRSSHKRQFIMCTYVMNHLNTTLSTALCGDIFNYKQDPLVWNSEWLCRLLLLNLEMPHKRHTGKIMAENRKILLKKRSFYL